MPFDIEWIASFHIGIRELFAGCSELVADIKDLDFKNVDSHVLLLRQIRSLSALCIELDPERDAGDVDEAFKFFRIAHLSRCPGGQIVEGMYASYHDLAWNESEDLLVFLRASDIRVESADGILVPDDGPRSLIPEAVIKIASASVLSKLNPDAIRAHLQLESLIAIKDFGSNDGHGALGNKMQVVAARYKPENCPECGAKMRVTKTSKSVRYLKCPNDHRRTRLKK